VGLGENNFAASTRVTLGRIMTPEARVVPMLPLAGNGNVVMASVFAIAGKGTPLRYKRQ
jgi:hypothetical protein